MWSLNKTSATNTDPFAALESEISDPLATYQALQLDPFSDLYQDPELLVLSESEISDPLAMYQALQLTYIRNYWSLPAFQTLESKFRIHLLQ